MNNGTIVHGCRLGYRRRNAPFDHRDLHGVVHDKARDHGIGENRERLPPRQWHESRETHARQDGARERIRHEGRHEGLAGHRRPEPAALPRGHDGEHGKVEQHQEAEGVEGIVVGRQTEMRPADPQEEERLRDHRDAQHHGHGDEASDVPCFRFLGRPNVVGGQGDLREVRHEDQQQHRKGGDDELAGHHDTRWPRRPPSGSSG